ncbi:Organic solute transporter subunit alpha [Varanus komodoensis]|uniref:organic solute transporter subunit alpha-like n=1 Tax=Varanus komodoensis TaxID=61221 RepID=UPI001CF7E308|nr:organic solute transporter subunit alpha-like [Varanus komodoensis]KAF7251276.1 Organic solute transporter subunit alpha [Varanus komodoensis]
MEEVVDNRTLDPACTADERPFSHVILESLDLTGILLFAMLTLMTFTAILVFVEEVFYIYHKIPPSKRSIFVWINGVAPVIATTSCIGMWIPRSTMFADFAAAVFFAIVNHKFLLMMMVECSGQKSFLRYFANGRFKISTGPCCCCCLCLPNVHINRRTLFLLKLGTFQFAFLCPVLLLLSVVLWTNRNYSLSDLSFSGAAIWINCFIGVLTLIALWPIGIMFQQVRVLLGYKKITPKFVLYQFVLILNQLQATIINVLAMEEVIACVPPLSSSARGAYMNQQLLIMEMFLITLISRVVYRKRYDLEFLQDSDQATKGTKRNNTISEKANICEKETTSI